MWTLFVIYTIALIYSWKKTIKNNGSFNKFFEKQEKEDLQILIVAASIIYAIILCIVIICNLP